MIMVGGIKNGGVIRRKSDGRIFTDVHVSATGKISATEKVPAEVVRKLDRVPEVLNYADPAEFEAWDEDNTNPMLPVVRAVGVGDFVEWKGLVARVEAIEGESAKLDVGVRAPLAELARLDAYGALLALRAKHDALLAQVVEMRERVDEQEAALAAETAKALKLSDDLKMREARIDVLETRNREMEKRLADVERINGLQHEKLIEVAAVGMRNHRLIYDPISETEAADEFINEHLRYGARHWTETPMRDGRVMVRIASRKPGEKVIAMPTEDKKTETETKKEESA